MPPRSCNCELTSSWCDRFIEVHGIQLAGPTASLGTSKVSFRLLSLFDIRSECLLDRSMAWFGLLCSRRSCPRPRGTRPQSRLEATRKQGLWISSRYRRLARRVTSRIVSAFTSPLVSKPLASDPFCSPRHDSPAFPWSRSRPDFAALSSAGCVVSSDITPLVHCNGLSPSEGR